MSPLTPRSDLASSSKTPQKNTEHSLRETCKYFLSHFSDKNGIGLRGLFNRLKKNRSKKKKDSAETTSSPEPVEKHLQ